MSHSGRIQLTRPRPVGYRPVAGNPRNLFCVLAVSAIASAMLLTPVTAAAQCLFDGPAKARKFQTSLVRSMHACPAPSLHFPASNTQTAAGTGACAPPIAVSEFSFGERGNCSIRASVKIEDPCSDGSGIPCSDLKVKVKCSGLLDPNGVPVDAPHADGWNLGFVVQVTLNENRDFFGNGEHSGDMTVMDVRYVSSLPDAKRGKLKGEVSTNSAICHLLGACPPRLSDCANTEIVSLSLRDPTGAIFAVPGSSTR